MTDDFDAARKRLEGPLGGIYEIELAIKTLESDEVRDAVDREGLVADLGQTLADIRLLLDEVERLGRLNANQAETIRGQEKTIKRFAAALIDANRLDYPWKDGSRASKALDEAEALRGEGEK